MLLNDLDEYVARQNLLRVPPISSFKDVFPQLPVIAIILPNEFSLTILEVFVKKFRVLLTLICLDFFSDLLILFTIANDDFFLKAYFK